MWGGLIGGFVKLIESGLNLWHGVSEGAAIIGNRLYAFFGINLSPALIAVGYIVGLSISLLVFLGGVISWWIAIPVIMWGTSIPDGHNLVAAGYVVWSDNIRYIEVGAKVVGGLYALIDLRQSISLAVRGGFHAV